MILALRYSRFIRAIFSREIPFGHSISQAPVLVQLPNPSRSICFTMFKTRVVASTRDPNIFLIDSLKAVFDFQNTSKFQDHSQTDMSSRNMELDLSGSKEYQVTLNGKTFLTTEDRLSLNLEPGMLSLSL